MSPPSEHERHAQFLRHYAESEVALHTFVRSLVPTRQMASEVMQGIQREAGAVSGIEMKRRAFQRLHGAPCPW